MDDGCIFDLADAPASVAVMGQKGSHLAVLNRLGIPVPPAFVLSTEAFTRWRKSGDRLPEALSVAVRRRLKQLEASTGLAMGHPLRPLLVSVRSGSAVSMPGMMCTVLNVGVSTSMAVTWLSDLEDEDQEFFAETYARFLNGYFRAAGGGAGGASRRWEALEGQAASPKARLDWLIAVAREAAGALPEDPAEQVLCALEAVFRSWDAPGAVAYRRAHAIPATLGTAVVIQQMVFGHRNRRSATGLACTRDATTGARALSGRYLIASQGERLVGPHGPAQSMPIERLETDIPEAFEALSRYSRQIEEHFGWPQDLEFTVESGRVWFLQARPAALTPLATLRVAVELVDEGRVTEEEAVERVSPVLTTWSQRRFSGEAVRSAVEQGRLLTSGLTASPGIAVGPMVLGPPRPEHPFVGGILLQVSLDPVHDLGLIETARGLVSLRGGTASHASTLAKLLRKPYVTGCPGVTIDLDRRCSTIGSVTVEEGTVISLDATGGNIFLGELASEVEPEPPELKAFNGWYRKHSGRSRWQTACYPDRVRARSWYRERLRQALAATEWHTAKATAVDLLRQVIPESVRIPQFVVAAGEKARLRSLMLDGIRAGAWIGLRPCYSVKKFGKGTWQMAIRTPEEVDRFLEQADFEGLLKAGGYPRWLEDESLEEIIVVWDPPGKGLPELMAQQFAFSVTCLPGCVHVELVLGTSHIRYLEGADAERLVHLSMQIDPIAPMWRGRQRMQFGRGYLDGQGMGPKEAAGSGDAGSAARPLVIETGEASDAAVRRVRPDALHVARCVARAVFDDWWGPPFELPHAMCALDAEYGLHSLEFQGRMADENGNVEYMLLFDVKGAEESQFLQPGR